MKTEETVKMSVITELFNNKGKYLHSVRTGYIGIAEGDYNGSQGEYNERFVYYRHPEMPESYFMQETYDTDSYGNEEKIVSVQFVKGVEKTIKVFEPIR